MRKISLILSLLLCCLWRPALGQTTEGAAPHRADWMTSGSYGMMTHYLITPKGETPEAKTADFNRTVDSFDLAAYIKTFDASGADWLIFTIGQNTNYYCSPNEYLDKALPGHTSRRDVIKELATAVHARGKRFIAYLPAETMAPEPVIQQVFGWDPESKTVFQQRYTQFIRAYAVKLGPLCDGWWLDGCYPDPPVNAQQYDWPMWIAACRGGNPAAIVAFNDGAFCVGRLKPVTPLEDYHAGEVHLLENGMIRTDFLNGETYTTPDGKVRKRGQPMVTYMMPVERFVGDVQWHALVPLDSTFNGAVPVAACSYSDAVLRKFVRDCKAVGGAVTLNVPLDVANGHVPEKSAAKLARLGQYLRELDASKVKGQRKEPTKRAS